MSEAAVSLPEVTRSISADISFINSNKGKPLLVANNYIFKLNKTTATTKYWICTLNECLAKVRHVNGPIQLSEDATVAEHNGPDFVSSSFRVHQTYSRGIYSTRLLFKTLSSSNSFIGIIESNANQSISLLYGWFIGDKQMFRIWLSWIHNPLKHYFTCEETQNHTIEMKIDCNKLKIVLKHKEMNEKYELDIDRKQTPLPWQIIIKLDHHGDRVRLQQ
ncbi:unnamed protein product [Rotaria sp. Silwood1]|nr:unnamed protein product [Rotaria sp. Silwood1]